LDFFLNMVSWRGERRGESGTPAPPSILSARSIISIICRCGIARAAAAAAAAALLRGATAAARRGRHRHLIQFEDEARPLLSARLLFRIRIAAKAFDMVAQSLVSLQNSPVVISRSTSMAAHWAAVRMSAITLYGANTARIVYTICTDCRSLPASVGSIQILRIPIPQVTGTSDNMISLPQCLTANLIRCLILRQVFPYRD
jgi:hypothetical protein